jgi:hypothetical protein
MFIDVVNALIQHNAVRNYMFNVCRNAHVLKTCWHVGVYF